MIKLKKVKTYSSKILIDIKKYKISLISICVLVLTVFILKGIFIENEKSAVYSKDNISGNERLNYFKEYLDIKSSKNDNLIKSRYTLFNKEDITIGKNVKETQNGYFDIRIKCINNTAQIEINKLIKEDLIKKSDKDVQINDDYISELVDILNNAFKYDLDSNKKQELLQYIKEGYICIRSVENVDSQSDKIKNTEKLIGNNLVSLSVQENTLIVNIKDKI